MQRETDRETNSLTPNVERERESQTCIFVGFRDRNGINDGN